MVTLLLVGWLGLAAANFQAKTLVILDDPTVPNSHSIFFKNLQGRGHKLTFTSAKDRSLRLGKFGEFQYDNLILYSPGIEDFGGDFDVDHYMKFIKAGGNALVIVDSGLTETNREIGNECGVDFHAAGKRVVDHVSHDSASNDEEAHLKIIGEVSETALPIAGGISAPIVYKGIAHEITPHTFLVTPVLTTSATGYSESAGKGVSSPGASGANLVSAVQGRNSARIVFAGSKELFSNKYFNAPVKNGSDSSLERSGNEEFTTELTKWNFGEKGILRAVNLTHTRVETGEVDPSIYRIRDNVDVSVVIEEYDASLDAWKPYKADDVQLEFIMLDPYVRVTLTHDGKGAFSTTFKAPDVYGCYKFRIDYKRPGYSIIELISQVSVRPYRHDEYERFLLVAYPYYASAFSMMAGFFIFSIYFLYGHTK